MEQATIDQGIAELARHGFRAEQTGECIVVQDPVHSCGIGANAGRLVLTGYEACTLRTGNAVSKFLYDRVF
jgi:hypothetical protein